MPVGLYNHYGYGETEEENDRNTNAGTARAGIPGKLSFRKSFGHGIRTKEF